MVHVQFTRHLQRFFPELTEVQVEANSVDELIRELDRMHDGLRAYLVDDQGSLRQHVNVFVEDTMIEDRVSLSDPLTADAKVFIMQALSGG